MKRWRKAVRSSVRAGLAASAGLVLAAAAVSTFAEKRLSNLAQNGLGVAFSTRVYGAPFTVSEGLRATPAHLLSRLEKLRYRRVGQTPVEEGEYSVDAATRTVLIHLRGFSLPWDRQPPAIVALRPQSEDGWAVSDLRERPLAKASLEPQRIAELSGPEKVRREPAAIGEIPMLLKKAVVSVEDKRFFTHWGIDPHAIARALWANLRGRGVKQGGSTITQQLAKNLFLTPRRTLARKAAEAALALYLEARYSKEELITLYLNHIYLGQDGAVSVAGVKAAAEFYFKKKLPQLTVEQCALLAGMIRSPYRYDPWRDPAASRERRDFVLQRMAAEGAITPEEAARAQAAPLAVSAKPAPERGDPHAYFVAEVIRRVLPRFGEDAVYRNGLAIHTTLDPLLQEAAQRSLKGAKHQAALVSMDAPTGRVLAMAGGRDFAESQFNRATQARRQPGSAFKPFVYGAALEGGLTPATLVVDEPRSYPGESAGKVWEPKNYDGVYFGTTTMRTALALSLNGATLDLADRVGAGRIAAFARRLGIESKVEANLGVGLGIFEVTLLELVDAYAPFANGGLRVAPLIVTAVFDSEGQLLETQAPRTEPALAPAVSRLMTSMLETTVLSGTARWLPAHGFARPAAGKTGTTDDGRDAWFIGFTPRLLTGVWVGSDENKAISVTGAKDAVPLWAAFMREADSDGPAPAFADPEGLVEKRVDPSTGQLARSGCPQTKDELFVSGTEPTAYCEQHAGGIKGFLRRLFGSSGR